MSEIPIIVSVPAAAAHVRIIRMVASASAARAGLGLDKLDDLALAIDEACGALLRVAATDTLDCSIRIAGHGIDVVIRGRGGSTDPWPVPGWEDTLEGIVLAGVADDVAAIEDAGDPAIRFALTA